MRARPDALCALDLDAMVPAIVVQWDPAVGLLGAVAHDAADRTSVVSDVDVIDGLAIAVVDRELAPALRDPRLDLQLIDVEPYPEQCLGDQLVHPAGRAGV